MQYLKCSCIALLIILRNVCAAAASSGGPAITPDEALAMLKEGNERYSEGKSRQVNQNQERRDLTAEHGQHPFATVITCSDSRVPVEIVFDRGIGDVFVIRVAAGSLKVLGAVYDLQTGRVSWMGEHPDQKGLLVLTGGPNAGGGHH